MVGIVLFRLKYLFYYILKICIKEEWIRKHTFTHIHKAYKQMHRHKHIHSYVLKYRCIAVIYLYFSNSFNRSIGNYRASCYIFHFSHEGNFHVETFSNKALFFARGS